MSTRRRNEVQDPGSILLFGTGVVAGASIAIQSVLNATLGERLGNFGSVLALTLVSILALLVLIWLFPSTASFGTLPGWGEWYLYAGGLLGVMVLAAPIYLVPRVGATYTLVAMIVGQLLAALLVDSFGLFASPRIDATFPRIFGAACVVIGAFFVTR
jgi:transporter family-2 protein